jgi:hypothetical protein
MIRIGEFELESPEASAFFLGRPFAAKAVL